LGLSADCSVDVVLKNVWTLMFVFLDMWNSGFGHVRVYGFMFYGLLYFWISGQPYFKNYGFHGSWMLGVLGSMVLGFLDFGI